MINDKTTEEKASQLNDRLTAGVKEMSEWATEARRAWNYYSSKQWSDLTESERKKVMPIVANVIRRDLDQMVGRVLDADPIITPVGRYGLSIWQAAGRPSAIHERCGRELA